MNSNRQKRHRRIRAKIKGKTIRPRLCVFRSAKHIYAQIIDDRTGKVLLSARDLELNPKKGEPKTKVDIAFKVGEMIAKKALEKKISKIIFDRGGYKYHGRVKSLAEGARKQGLKF